MSWNNAHTIAGQEKKDLESSLSRLLDFNGNFGPKYRLGSKYLCDMNTEGLMLHAHILELLMITLEICVYIHVEIQIHSSQVQDFLCLL